MFDQQTHSALSDVVRANVLRAFEDVRTAVSGSAAATLRLCIALEHAAQTIMQALGVDPVTRRDAFVTKLSAWARSFEGVAVSINETWGKLHPLLVTHEDRAFWQQHAHRVRSIQWLLTCGAVVFGRIYANDHTMRLQLWEDKLGVAVYVDERDPRNRDQCKCVPLICCDVRLCV